MKLDEMVALTTAAILVSVQLVLLGLYSIWLPIGYAASGATVFIAVWVAQKA
jgi:hypothetical protein